MDIVKSIQIFQKVIEEKSFSRAAERLNLVPSAVSRQVSELEKWLGVRLINRTTRSLHLTQEGKEYLTKMELITNQIEELRSFPKPHQQLTGDIKITAPMMLGQQVILNVLSKFKSLHPEVRFSLSLMNRKVDLIEEGYDLAIRAGHLSDSNLHARRLGNISFKTVASNTYLAKSPRINVPKDLLEHNCLIHSALSNPRRWTYRVNDVKKVIKVNGDIETNESACIQSFAKSGYGIALLPELYVQNDLACGELVEILSDYAPEPLPVNIIFTSNRLLSPAVRALIDYIAINFDN